MSESFDARAWLKAQEQNTQPVTPTSAARPFDAKDWLNAQQSRTQNASELGLQQAADFTAQLAKYPTASPVQQYQAFEKYGQQFQDHLAQQGYSGEQITNALASFGQQADPRNQSSGWDTAVDLGNSVLKGTGRLMVDALSAVPESTPLIGELAEYLQKEGEGKLRTIEKEYSAAKQINDYLGNREEQKALENGANEVSALLANLKTNPMQLPHLLAEQVPQVLLGVATGGVGLGAVNAAGGVGRARNDIEQAYEDTYKNNPQQLLQLPEIQERMAKGMSFADAVNDAKTDVTDHWKSLAAAAVIGASEALTPTGKLGQGVNRGVLKTLGKEAGQEFLQEGAEQLNSNLAVGQIDGKTQATDNVLRNATLGAIAGLGMGVPAATEAYINGRNAPQAEEPVVNPESPIQPEQPTTTLINSQALDEALKPYQDSEDYAEMRADLEQDIQDGVIEERAKSNSQYGKLAQAYLNATGQVTAEPQAESNTQEQAEINDGTDPEMERVLNLRERMTAWRNGKKLGKIGDLLPAMMTFKNEDAKRDFVVQQAFGEVQSIAKKHGIDPTDGNAMRKWLDDYVAKRKEVQTKAKQTREESYRAYDDFLSNEPLAEELQQAVENPQNVTNLPDNFITQASNEAFKKYEGELNALVSDVYEGKITAEEFEQRKNAFIHAVSKEATEKLTQHQDFVPYIREKVLAHNKLTQAEESLQQTANTTDNGNGSIELDQQMNQGGGATTSDLRSNSPIRSRTEEGAVGADNVQQSDTQYNQQGDTPRFSLNENSDSPFVKAVDTVANGGQTTGKYIAMGTTPDVLKMLGLPDANIRISDEVIHKVMSEYLGFPKGNRPNIHNLSPEVLKQLPTQLNNPVAVFNSSTRENAYVVLTELFETKVKTGKTEPVIAALHIKPTKNGVEVLNITSVYGRGKGQLKTAFNNDLRYVNKEKAQHILNTQSLQLGWDFTSDVELSTRNVKTETDLSQYQNLQSEQSIDTESDEQLTQESYSRSPIKSVDANIKRGREAMNTAIAERRTVHRAMFNHNLDGWVDFEWGDVGTVKANGKTKGGMGISHILEARMRKDGMSYEQAIQMLVSDVVDVIARGHTVFEKTVGNSQNIRMEHNGYQVTLTKNKGNNAWIVTAFELFEGANRKGHDKSIPTDTNPTLSRAGTGASNAASDSEQFARNNRSQLNDTHAHSQRGRGVVAENGLNLNNSQQNVNVEESHARELLRRALGEHADKIEFVRDEQFGENDARRGAEGWYHNGKLYLNLDGITDGNILSKDERLVWVAWHELGHHGVEVQLSHALRNQLYQARKNVVVNGIAKRIFAERQAEAKRENNPSLAISQDVATEEAIVELFAAMETGNWAEIENRYRVHIVQEWRQPQSDLVKRLSHVANFFKRLVARITGRNLDTVSNQEVLNLLATVKQGIAKSAENPTASYARYSLSEESDSDFAKAVDAFVEGNEVKTSISMGTTPDVLKMIGLSDVEVKIKRQTLGKVMRGRHSIEPETLKQLPQQMNDPVGVFQSAPHSSNPDGYVVLTELTEFNQENQRNEPVIAALHLNKKGEVQLIDVASVYGKNHQGLQNILNKDKAFYWNKAKGSQLANVHWLQLPLKLRSDANLSANDIKTETDLSQYQSENSDIRFSRSENLTRADYDQAKENGETELDFNQWKQVRSPEFKRWFGDWENDPDDASKVINDETFEPLQVFHGSPENFHIFDDRFSSKNTGNEGLFGKGFYFAKDGLEAVRYAKGNENGITSAYLNIKNPFTLTPENIALLPDWYVDKVGIVPIKKGALDGKISIDSISRLTKDGKYGNDFRKALSEAGFDGASTEFDPYKPEGVVYVAFEPNQIKSATDNNGEFSSENDDIRFSRKQTSMEILTDGKVKHETLWGTIKAGEFGKIWNEVQRKTDFALTDETRPVLDWIGDLDLAQVQANELKSDFELADGVRHSLNSQLMQRFLKPLHKNIVNLAKKRKKDIEWTKKALGIWVSANYSVQKNQELLARDEQAMIEAKQAFDDAKANGTNAEIDKAERAYIRAERQYRYRKHDVELNNWEVDEKGKFIVPRKVGVAGFSIPHAKALMAEVEKHFSQKEVLEATEPLRKAVKWNIHKNREFNRITEEQFKEYMRNLDYVPLTGDPDSLLKDDDDFIGGASSKGVNTSRDKNMKGRVNSEAEDAIDAVYRMLDKTVANAAWQPFKNGIDAVYEQKLAEAKAQGMTEEQAKEHVADTVGIRRQVMQGTTRTNDEVLIRKFGNVYYEYRLPEDVIKAIKGGQRNVDEFKVWQYFPMRYVRKLTGLYAQGVTQFKLPFAPKNMIRDIWEKSALITTRDIYDANGKPLSQKAKNRIGNRTFSALANPAEMARVLRATSRLAKGDTENLDVSDEYQRDLKELIELGGVSNYSTYLARTDKDLVEEIKKLDKPHHRAVEGALHLVAVWNGTFDYASSLAAYRALKEAGVDKKQAADITLNLTNFRKQGWAAKHFKPLYMFLNPTLQGGKNLVQMMKTRRGQVYLASRVVMAMAVWSLLMSLDDEDDQSGKRMLANGDLSREILIPTGEKDKYIRIPVGYGAPQMANNIATNLVQLMNNQISVGDAVANIITHNVKSVLPIAPSEISASKAPLAKLADTLTPSLFKAQMQWLMDRNAFGASIKPNSVQREKLLSQQSRQNTAEFWKETAEMMYEQFGVDMHPEFYKHIFDSYRGMMGSLGDYVSASIENPNRALQGKSEVVPIVNDYYGVKGENRIASLFYEYKGEAEKLAAEYKYYESKGRLAEWKTPEKMQIVNWNNKVNNDMKEVTQARSDLKKDEGKMSKEMKASRLQNINTINDRIQREAVYAWRKREGLATANPR
ncbi:LPD38 domain-containing protein [Haemophilus parahaemolyticus]|uniref:MuF-C-terminal domain-containing protein n=1 Tax=Haemophilus parahaemolyticus TaxID=735 RepID=UPI0028D18D55|nr:LPD38 domain-containing protein [Haemophilus parahaemolyticus]